jgi:hypothetical protein
MQAPLHSLVLPGQVVPQARPSQVAVPPLGTGQAMHEVGPQLLVLVSETHFPLHR